MRLTKLQEPQRVFALCLVARFRQSLKDLARTLLMGFHKINESSRKPIVVLTLIQSSLVGDQ